MQYKPIRKTLASITNKIINHFLSRERVFKSANLLGYCQNDIMMFDTENDMYSIIDFALFDLNDECGNLFQHYKNIVGYKNKIEKQCISGALSSNTTLCQVKEIYSKNFQLLLTDLLNENATITLIDVNLSETIKTGSLIFARFIPIDYQYITSGMSFVFDCKHKDILLNLYRRALAQNVYKDERINRFICFNKLHQKYGLPIILQKI